LEVIRKIHNLKVYANYVQCNLSLVTGLLFSWRRYHDSFCSLERDYSLSIRDMTLEKGLKSQHSKDVQLHNLLRSPQPVNKLHTISASMYKVIAVSCKKTSKILCKQLLHQCVDSCASFLNQNGLNSQLAMGWGGYSTKHLNGKYLSGTLVLKYPDSLICFYCVQYAFL